MKLIILLNIILLLSSSLFSLDEDGAKKMFLRSGIDTGPMSCVAGEHGTFYFAVGGIISRSPSIDVGGIVDIHALPEGVDAFNATLTVIGRRIDERSASELYFGSRSKRVLREALKSPLLVTAHDIFEIGNPGALYAIDASPGEYRLIFRLSLSPEYPDLRRELTRNNIVGESKDLSISIRNLTE